MWPPQSTTRPQGSKRGVCVCVRLSPLGLQAVFKVDARRHVPSLWIGRIGRRPAR